MRALILDFCKEPKNFLEIMNLLNLKDRVNFKRVYISPLIAEGLLSMTDPTPQLAETKCMWQPRLKSPNCTCKHNHLYPNGASQGTFMPGSPILRFEYD